MWWPMLATLWWAQLGPDSLGVLRAAHSAQADFEAFRIDHLPWTRGGRSGRCDEVVGRFCFWHDEDDGWKPLPEPPAIRAARERMVRALDSLGALSPNDQWILGQRVRYLVEAGRFDEAQAATHRCGGDGWWCSALAGYVLHSIAAFAAADSAFGVALWRMPQAQRCDWTDLGWLLDGLRKIYNRRGCANRTDLERRIWWLSDPLYMVAGNELRTEFYARQVQAALQEGAKSAYGVRWGDDLAELLIRYGWPIAWERETAGSASGSGVISHNPPHSWSFVAPAPFVENPSRIAPARWKVDAPRPVSSYAPAYATAFHDLPHQLAVFRRGDSVVVVAAFDITVAEGRDSALSHRVESALVLAPDEGTQPIVVRTTGGGAEQVLAALAPTRSTLLSLEALDRGDSTQAARARYWLALAPRDDRIAMSDALLFRTAAGDSVPPTLPDVLPLVRGTANVSRDERLGVYWETYGLESRSEPFRMELSVSRARRGWLRGVAEWAGLVGREGRYVSLAWEEAGHPGVPIYGRSLTIALPDAPPGPYDLEISLIMQGATVARTTRTLTVVR